MTPTNEYLFKTERLGIRNWQDTDLPTFIEMCASPEVMKYFPSTSPPEKTVELVRRMQAQYEKKGYAYLPVELLETQEFIGFIGIMDQDYGEYLPAFVDIGWRLKESAWGKGYATEGAQAWMDFAFEKLELSEIYSVATMGNLGSQRVMQKLGMGKIDEFDHPKIEVGNPQRRCCLYKKENLKYQQS